MAVTSLLDTVFRRRKKKSTEFISNSAVLEFDFDTIRAARNEFSDLVGRGGFGSVYKGRLEVDDTTSFNPKLDCKCTDKSSSTDGIESTETKVTLRIYPHRAFQLSWEMCLNIVDGIARDLKPKIEGFELARMMQQGEIEAESTVIAGTVGYLDPEYIRSGHVSVKSDVYAFGVTILTIISRRKAWSVVGDSLIEDVKRCWNRGEVMDVIHEVIRKGEREDSISEILRYIQIALLCIDENAETRPSIDKVLHWFSCLSTPLPEPNHW